MSAHVQALQKTRSARRLRRATREVEGGDLTRSYCAHWLVERDVNHVLLFVSSPQNFHRTYRRKGEGCSTVEFRVQYPYMARVTDGIVYNRNTADSLLTLSFVRLALRTPLCLSGMTDQQPLMHRPARMGVTPHSNKNPWRQP